MSRDDIDRMPWSMWSHHRKFADWRLGLRTADDLNSEEVSGYG